MKIKSKRENVSTRIRVPVALLELIDKLVEMGYFQSRTDFLLESIRLLISRYFPESAVKTAINRSLKGRPTPKPYARILSEEERLKVAEFFEGMDALEVSRWSRERL
ncbi:MAG: ribbon-helix-helix domain-containing protein [Candidatus Freyarchaeota archaeon]